MLTAIVVIYLFSLGVLGLASLWWFHREAQRAAVDRKLLARRVARTAHRVAALSRTLRHRATIERDWDIGEAERDPILKAALALLAARWEAPPQLRERLLRLATESRPKEEPSAKPDPGAT